MRVAEFISRQQKVFLGLCPLGCAWYWLLKCLPLSCAGGLWCIMYTQASLMTFHTRNSGVNSAHSEGWSSERLVMRVAFQIFIRLKLIFNVSKVLVANTVGKVCHVLYNYTYNFSVFHSHILLRPGRKRSIFILLTRYLGWKKTCCSENVFKNIIYSISMSSTQKTLKHSRMYGSWV